VSPAAIALDAVSRHYATPAGVVHAIEDVTLHVEAGTSVAITGSSGCGKSTLLGLIAGLETPTAGRVTIGVDELSSLSEEDRARLRRERLGLVFQADNLQPFLTARENVTLQLALRGAKDGHLRSFELLDELGLAEQADRLPDQLSGGQRQRIAVAGALIGGPALILADEPTGSLDAANSDVIVSLLLEAQRSRGATLVVVTHDPAVAARLDRVVRLRDGRLEDAVDA
jgi:putative ABC transport system ATP-binding protein